MGISTQTVFQYNGSLASLQAGDLVGTNLLNGGSGPLQAEIRDNNGFLSQDDDGVSTLTLADGSVISGAIDYLGSGTMSTIAIAGFRLDTRPVAAFSVDGQAYLIAPNGFPLLSGVSITFDIDANAPFALNNFAPCFVEGTLILTPDGPKPIEELEEGDKVLDHNGEVHNILWHGNRAAANREPDYPVRVPAGFFGPRVPFVDTFVSQQHRIAMYLPEFGTEPLFARAKILIEEGLELVQKTEGVVYHHLLFARHIVLIANGMPAESLLATRAAQATFGQEAWEEITAAMPSVIDVPMEPCLRELRRGELQRRRRKSERLAQQLKGLHRTFHRSGKPDESHAFHS